MKQNNYTFECEMSMPKKKKNTTKWFESIFSIHEINLCKFTDAHRNFRKKNFDKIKIKITIQIKNTMASVNLHWFISCMGKINLAIFAHTYMISGASKAINFF